MIDRLETLLSFLQDDPDDAFTRFAIATEYLKRDHPEQALQYFEALRRDQPNYTGTYYHLGKLYETLGRTNDAVEAYRSGIGVAESQRDFHAAAELRDALMKAEGVGEDEDW